VIYKGMLLDIDNTLYDYNITHKKAKEEIIDYCVKKIGLTNSEVDMAYNIARKRVHIELIGTASSHNRLIYFQKMLEALDINPLKYAFDMYNIYWNSFLDNLKPFNGIYDLLEKYRGKICLITDLTADVQYQKIKKLKLDYYCNKLVTSEEAGKEKPHPYIFMLALKKLICNTYDEVIMIGDNFKKDILGAVDLKMKAIWFNHKKKEISYNNSLIKEVNKFTDILELI